jgi:hypothetical protein
MRQIGACERAALHFLAARHLKTGKVRGAIWPAPLDDARGHCGQNGMNGHD